MTRGHPYRLFLPSASEIEVTANARGNVHYTGFYGERVSKRNRNRKPRAPAVSNTVSAATAVKYILRASKGEKALTMHIATIFVYKIAFGTERERLRVDLHFSVGARGRAAQGATQSNIEESPSTEAFEQSPVVRHHVLASQRGAELRVIPPSFL